MLFVAESVVRRVAALAAVLIGATAGLAAWSPSAGAERAEQCAMSGGIGGPNPAQVDDLVSVSVAVNPNARNFCNGSTVAIRGGGRTLCSSGFIFGRASCTITFRAFLGLGRVTASLNTGQSLILGTFTVLGGPTATHRPPPPVPVTTVTHTVARPAAVTTAAAASRVRIPAPTKPDPHRKSSASAPDPYPWHPAPGPTAPPTDEPGASVSAVAVVTTAHGGGASPIPLGLLIGALAVLGVFVTAAARLVATHVRSEIGA